MLRLRLLIPAAIAAIATYAALVRDEVIVEVPGPQLTTSPALEPPAPAESVVAPAPDAPPAPPAERHVGTPEAPASPSPYADLMPPVMAQATTPSVYDLLAGAPMETPALPIVDVGDPWQVVLDEGRFALGGWAASAGHSMVSAVTFRRRLPNDVGPDQILLEIDASENVLDSGLTVLSDPGFAPDRDGFTILLQAAEPGPFSAAGSYRVLPAG